MDNFAEFHFLRPLWLTGIPLLLLLTLMLHFFKRTQSGWTPLLAAHLVSHLVSNSKQQSHRLPIALLAIAWCLACVALAGPAWEKLPQPVFQLHKGRVIVIDMSISMRATDTTPDRLSRAKFKAMDLVNQLTEGETGLVAYAGDAFTISPLSTDANNLLNMIPSLAPEIMPVSGDEPITGIELAQSLLTSAGYQQGDIFWLTDGIAATQVTELQKLAGKHPYRISVLAVGTAKGAPISMSDGELYKDSGGNIVVPKLVTRHLQAITKKTLGNFTTLTNDDSDITHLLRSFELPDTLSDEPTDSQNDGDQWHDAGIYLLLLLLPLVAYAFRRGVVYLFAGMILVPLASPPAHADWWQNMWKTQNQQAATAYDSKDYKTASQQFTDPAWQGISYYRDGDYQAAAEIFSQLPDAESQYNLGNAELQQGNLEQAIEAYERTLAAVPNHEDALSNKALAEEMLKQQQDNQQQDNQQQDNKQSDDQDSEQESSDKDNPQQQEGDQQQQESEEQQQESEEQQSQDSESSSQQQEQQEQEQQQQKQDEQGKDSEAEALGEERELTEAEKEQQQQMQLLLNKVTDDPAYLLRKRMELEYRKRMYDTKKR